MKNFITIISAILLVACNSGVPVGQSAQNETGQKIVTHYNTLPTKKAVQIMDANDPELSQWPYLYYTAYRAPTAYESQVYSNVAYDGLTYNWWDRSVNDMYISFQNYPTNEMIWGKIITSLNVESTVNPLINAAIANIPALIPSLTLYTGSAGNPYTQESSVKMIATSATTSSGNAVFYLTNDGTSSGTALCTQIVYDNTASFEINNANSSYRWSWSVAGNLKSLTAAITQSSSISVAGIQVLTALAPANNGTLVRLNLYCK